VIVFVESNLNISQIDKLDNILLPVSPGDIFSYSIGFHFLIIPFSHRFVLRPPQYVNNHGDWFISFKPVNTRQGLLSDKSSIKELRGILTNITVAAVFFFDLTKVVEKDLATAGEGFSILFHAFKFG